MNVYPMHQSVERLAFAMEKTWITLRQRLEGLTDEEFFWEPVPDCWTVHTDERGRWVIDYAMPDPEPPPFTTIAWRLVHLAACKVMYHEYAFGAAQLTWDDLPLPRTAAEATAWLEEGHSRLQGALSGLADADLEEERLTNWGERWPTWRLFWTLIHHDAHHGAEIGCLRDLYRATRRRRIALVPLGRTGLTVSRLSFGTAILGPLCQKMTPEAGGDLLARAFELGVTFWDTSDDYGTHPHVAAALRQVPREQVIIASKTNEPEGAVEGALRELETDYLDIMLIHGVGLDSVEKAREALRVLDRHRAQGRVRALGLSTHSAEVAHRAAGWPEVEVLLGIVNPTGTWGQDKQIEDGDITKMLDALEQAYTAGKGVYAMKVLGHGTLAHDAARAIHFASRLPYVHSLCIGMRNLDEVRKNLALLQTTDAEDL